MEAVALIVLIVGLQLFLAAHGQPSMQDLDKINNDFLHSFHCLTIIQPLPSLRSQKILILMKMVVRACSVWQ